MTREESKGKIAVVPDRQAKEVDVLIGQNIRRHRLRAGLTLSELAALIGVTGQQMHKYETARNRISVGILHNISLAIGISISVLFEFEGVESKSSKVIDQRERARGNLIRDFLTIDNEDYRHAILILSRSLKEDK